MSVWGSVGLHGRGVWLGGSGARCRVAGLVPLNVVHGKWRAWTPEPSLSACGCCHVQHTTPITPYNKTVSTYAHPTEEH